MQPRGARVEPDDDDDLRRALELSLEDAQKKGLLKDVPPLSKPSTTLTTAKVSTPPNGEDEDEELKAEIAASLKDMEEQKARSAWSNPARFTENAPKVASAPRPDHELSPQEAENINLFATLVDRLQTQPPGTILREPQIQELYESIGALRPKLARTFGETMSKYEALCDLHAKLGTVVRYYDRMLEERLSYTYGRHGLGDILPQSSYAAPTTPANNMYPAMPPVDSYQYIPHSYQNPSAPPAQNPPYGNNYYGQQPGSDKPPSSYATTPAPSEPPQHQQQHQMYPQYTGQYNGYPPSTPSEPPQSTAPAQSLPEGPASSSQHPSQPTYEAPPGQPQQQQPGQQQQQQWAYPPRGDGGVSSVQYPLHGQGQQQPSYEGSQPTQYPPQQQQQPQQGQGHPAYKGYPEPAPTSYPTGFGGYEAPPSAAPQQKQEEVSLIDL